MPTCFDAKIMLPPSTRGRPASTTKPEPVLHSQDWPSNASMSWPRAQNRHRSGNGCGTGSRGSSSSSGVDEGVVVVAVVNRRIKSISNYTSSRSSSSSSSSSSTEQQ